MSLCGGVVGWGSYSHFRVHPNFCVEVVLRCDVVGVVTILKHADQLKTKKLFIILKNILFCKKLHNPLVVVYHALRNFYIISLIFVKSLISIYNALVCP